MSFYYRELQVHLTGALQLLSTYASASQSIQEAVTKAACCIYNKTTGNYITSGGGQVLIMSESSGGTGSTTGTYRKLIHNHAKLKNAGGVFRSSDAELKILDRLMTLTTWGTNYLVVIKVTRKPCPACSYAISKFFTEHSGQGALAVVWPGGEKIYGALSGPELA